MQEREKELRLHAVHIKKLQRQLQVKQETRLSIETEHSNIPPINVAAVSILPQASSRKSTTSSRLDAAPSQQESARTVGEPADVPAAAAEVFPGDANISARF